MVTFGENSTSNSGVARLYHEHPESAYPLPADFEEGERLDTQHKLFESHFYDGCLLPDYISLDAHAKVLDAGTGTGIWITDLASKLPSTTTFVGIVISPRLFPTSPASNITFTESSTTTPIPEDWSNSFSLVHQRTMVTAFRPSDWVSALSNFYRALIPGGYLILTEVQTYYDPDSKAINQAWSTAVEMMRLRGVDFEKCTEMIPGWLRHAGFVDVRTVAHQMNFAGPSDEAMGLRYNVHELLSGMSEAVASTAGLSWDGTPAEFQALVDDATREYERSVGSGFRVFWFTAQKPL